MLSVLFLACQTATTTTPKPVCAAGPVLNEVSSSNKYAFIDADGESPDWVEIMNPTDAPVDLSAWSLSDDPDDGPEWAFPAKTLAPGELMLVVASDEDRVDTFAWDTRAGQGDTWHYQDVTGPVDREWTDQYFDDDAWPTAPAGSFPASSQTLYVRTHVDLTREELADLRAMMVEVESSGAFVAYVNGVEVARAGIGIHDVQPRWDTTPTEVFTGRRAFFVPTSELTKGPNSVAIEVHGPSPAVTPIVAFAFGAGTDTGETPDLPRELVHAGFSLGDKDAVTLWDADGCPADSLDPGLALLADESYGRFPDGTGDLGFFMTPTPGAPNDTEVRRGFAATPVLDPPPGPNASGTVQITGNGAHYSVDGHVPTESDPSGAVTLSAEATVIRARAFAPDLWPSRVATGTYLRRAPRTLPVVSVAVDPDDLFDEETGIYTEGPYSEGPPLYGGANFMQSWERAAHVEMWEADGTPAFSVDAGIQLHGGYTRRFAQKGLLLDLGGYGDSEIEYPIYPDLPYESYERVLLRASGNDWHGCVGAVCATGAMLRDPLMQDLAAAADLDVMASRPAEVYLDGEFWGLYWLNQTPDASYVEAKFGEKDIDIVEYEERVVKGDITAWNELVSVLRSTDLASAQGWAEVERRVDVDELATYLVFEIFYDNTDWPGNNVKRWRPRRDDGKWRWFLYDTDFGMGLYGADPSHDSLSYALDPASTDTSNAPWSTEVFRLMFTSPQFQQKFLQRYADFLNTTFEAEAMQDRLWATAAEIEAEMPYQVERWGTGDGVSIPDGAWDAEIWWTNRWLEERPAYARQHVLDYFGLPGTVTLQLDAEPASAGTFELTAVTVESGFEGEYFQGVPVTITAVPAQGHTFSSWSDPSLGKEATITLPMDRAVSVVARFD